MNAKLGLGMYVNKHDITCSLHPNFYKCSFHSTKIRDATSLKVDQLKRHNYYWMNTLLKHKIC